MLSGAVTVAVKEFATDVATNQLKRNGSLVLPGPSLSTIGGVLYTASKWSRIRGLGVVIYNVGGAIIPSGLALVCFGRFLR